MTGLEKRPESALMPFGPKLARELRKKRANTPTKKPPKRTPEGFQVLKAVHVLRTRTVAMWPELLTKEPSQTNGKRRHVGTNPHRWEFVGSIFTQTSEGV